MLNLRVATKRICRTNSRRFGVGDRNKTLVHSILALESQRPTFRSSTIHRDEESAAPPRLTFTHMNWIERSATTPLPRHTDVVNICINEEEGEDEDEDEEYADETLSSLLWRSTCQVSSLIQKVIPRL